MIKVMVKGTTNEYVLLGAGHGMFKAQGQKGWSSTPTTSQHDERSLAVCGPDGKILWFETSKLRVVSVDGVGINECFI